MARKKLILKKRSFSLLEVMISICILAIAGSLILWNLKGFLERHRFDDSSQKIAEEMQKLKKLALYYQVEMEVDLISSDEGVKYRISSDEPLPFLRPSFINLPAIHEISLNNKPIGRVHLIFFANGLVYPSSVLGFHQKEKTHSVWIDLSKEMKLKSTFPNK